MALSLSVWLAGLVASHPLFELDRRDVADRLEGRSVFRQCTELRVASTTALFRRQGASVDEFVLVEADDRLGVGFVVANIQKAQLAASSEPSPSRAHRTEGDPLVLAKKLEQKR